MIRRIFDQAAASQALQAVATSRSRRQRARHPVLWRGRWIALACHWLFQPIKAG
jgi:hypothetical protein